MQRRIEALARLMAILGGLVLTVLILLTCVSVVGRSLNSLFHGPIEKFAPGFAEWAINMGVGPINGDFELVEAGVAFAIFAFIPLCQLQSGHAVVDIFTSNLPTQVNRVLQMVIDFVFAAVLVLIAVQLFGGLQTKLRAGEETFILQFPVWWGYAASLVPAIVSAIVGVYIAGIRFLEVMSGKTMLASPGEANH